MSKEAVGGDLELTIGGTTVAELTSCSLTISANMLEAGSKDSNFAESLSGKKSATIQFEGRYDDGDADSAFQFVDGWLNGTSYSAAFARTDTPAAGEWSKFAATAYVGSVELSANDDETMNISGTLEITGAVTKTDAV